MGCELDESECVDPKSEEMSQLQIEFLQLDQVIMFEEMDHDKVLGTFLNSKQYFKINPLMKVHNDRFFMDSKLRLEDDPFMLFESIEDVTTRNQELSLIEMGESITHYFYDDFG